MAVAVEVAQGGERASELVSGETAVRGADLLLGAHRSVGREKEDPHGAPRRAPVGVVRRAHREVGGPVPVEVAERRHGRAEPVVRVEHGREVPGRRSDLLLGSHGEDLGVRARGGGGEHEGDEDERTGRGLHGAARETREGNGRRSAEDRMWRTVTGLPSAAVRTSRAPRV